MPRVAIESNSRMSLRIRADEKTLLMRAVALRNTDLTDFVVQHALLAAKDVIAESEQVQLSRRDSLRVLDLLRIHPLRMRSCGLPQRSYPGGHEVMVRRANCQTA